ncbi:MAG TPA: Gfo/Idh/MocA family oxidoreductase [Pyrinomonadaceae bacterium]|nr:Gfo/Idh/MocA family oxidoreductase [Pyrinomonadaceae bacterium]
MINVALIGLGYWGPNLARNLSLLSRARLHAICDMRAERLENFGRQYSGVKKMANAADVFADPEIDAVVIATPVQTHFELAAAALRAGKHVMVEKPLAQSAQQCEELIALADARQLILMTGHVFIYNAAVRKVKEHIQSGELGEIYYIYSQRLNLGIIRQDVNALWNFCPHDFSILHYWLGATPERIFAHGYSYVQPGIEDVVFVTMDFPNGIGANVHISWLDPNKLRRMTVVGSEKMVIYDDVSADAKVLVYDKSVSKRPKSEMSLGHYENFGEFQLLLRAGDVLIPKIDFVEPLKLECQHFVDCILGGKQPLTDGRDGLKVVQMLEAAQASLNTTMGEGSKPVRLSSH